MSDLLLYWSPAQTEQYVQALNDDPAFQKAARKFDETLIFRCLGTPEGVDAEVQYRIANGKVTHTLRTEPAPSLSLRNAPFDKGCAFMRTTAPFAIWTRLDKGEMNVLQALTSPEYQLDGSKLRIMANIGVLNAMSATASRLPKRYA